MGSKNNNIYFLFSNEFVGHNCMPWFGLSMHKSGIEQLHIYWNPWQIGPPLDLVLHTVGKDQIYIWGTCTKAKEMQSTGFEMFAHFWEGFAPTHTQWGKVNVLYTLVGTNWGQRQDRERVALLFCFFRFPTSALALHHQHLGRGNGWACLPSVGKF